MKANNSIRLALPLFFFLQGGAVEDEIRLAVRHDHVFGSCEGILAFSGSGLSYETTEKGHSVSLAYSDIQQLGLDSDSITVLTYFDRGLYLGRDERLNFQLKDPLSGTGLSESLAGRLTRPLVSSLLPPQEASALLLQVRHRTWPKGAEGTLELGSEFLVFRSPAAGRSRIWRYEDLVSYGSTGPYQLRLTAMERTGGEFGTGRDYVFDLKAKLPEAVSDLLWERIHRPRIDRP